MWSVELEQAGNYEGIADRLRFHGSLRVADVVQNTGLSPQTVIKHLNRLVDAGRAIAISDSMYQHV
jgi:hypothetical protein